MKRFICIITGIMLIAPWPLMAGDNDSKDKAVLDRYEIEEFYRAEVIKNSPWIDRAEVLVENIRLPLNLSISRSAKDSMQAKFSPHEDFMGLTIMSLAYNVGRTKKTVHINGRVRVFASIPVAKSGIRRGMIISEKDLQSKRIDISTYPLVVMDIKSCIGMRVKTNLRPNRPIYKTNIERPPAVNRGEIVFIEARSDNLVVRDKGIALRDGYLTEKIPVKNAASGKQVIGTIIAHSTVEVKF